MKRFFAGIGLGVSIIIFPWWVWVPFAGLNTFIFSRYYEVIAFGLFVDLLYGRDTIIPFIFTISFIVLFFILEFIKSHIRT